MGLSLSLLSKLGVGSLPTDQIYEKFFTADISNFEDFHTNFIDLCKFINDVMPGKHFKAPTSGEVKTFYNDKWKQNSDEKRKEELVKFVKEKVKEHKPDDKALIMAGLVVPAAAVVAKNNAQNFPGVKQFKLHLIPNIVFVPTITFLTLAGIQLVQISKKSKL